MSVPHENEGHVEDSARSVAQLYADHDRRSSPGNRAIAWVIARAGRGSSAVAAACAVGAWMALNAGFAHAGLRVPDPPPFSYLQGTLSAAALFMTVLILALQRHENRLADQRAQLVLHLALVSEQKITKAIGLLEDLRRDDPHVSDRHDPQAQAMAKPTDALAGLDAIREAKSEMLGDGREQR